MYLCHCTRCCLRPGRAVCLSRACMPLLHVHTTGRFPEMRRLGRGFGPALSYDVTITLVRKRLPGALPFAAGTGRDMILV